MGGCPAKDVQPFPLELSCYADISPIYRPPLLSLNPRFQNVTTVSLPPNTQNNVSPDVAIKTPQFHALGITNFFVGCCGFGLFSVAKPMMGEVFSSTLPALVTAGFASAYVQVGERGVK